MLTGSHDRLGDDLDQRHTRAVVVDQRRCRAMDAAGLAAQVRQLAVGSSHVGPFDVHSPAGAVFQRHVQIAVDRDRLVADREIW